MADLVMLVFVAGLVAAGWRSGFLRRLIGLVFIVVSFVAGAYLRTPAGAIVNTFLPKIPSQYAEMVGYTVVFAGLTLVLNLFAKPILARVPKQGLSEATDKGLGAALGLVEGVVLLSAAIVVIHTYSGVLASTPGFKETGFLKDIKTQVDGSTIGQALESTTVPVTLAILGPLLPSDIKTIVPLELPPGSSGPGGGLPLP